jgi:hypothetical protein
MYSDVTGADASRFCASRVSTWVATAQRLLVLILYPLHP